LHAAPWPPIMLVGARAGCTVGLCCTVMLLPLNSSPSLWAGCSWLPWTRHLLDSSSPLPLSTSPCAACGCCATTGRAPPPRWWPTSSAACSTPCCARAGGRRCRTRSCRRKRQVGCVTGTALLKKARAGGLAAAVLAVGFYLRIGIACTVACACPGLQSHSPGTKTPALVVPHSPAQHAARPRGPRPPRWLPQRSRRFYPHPRSRSSRSHSRRSRSLRQRQLRRVAARMGAARRGTARSGEARSGASASAAEAASAAGAGASTCALPLSWLGHACVPAVGRWSSPRDRNCCCCPPARAHAETGNRSAARAQSPSHGRGHGHRSGGPRTAAAAAAAAASASATAGGAAPARAAGAAQGAAGLTGGRGHVRVTGGVPKRRVQRW
jgi:hypothetical protein